MGGEADLSSQVPTRTRCSIGRQGSDANGTTKTHFDEGEPGTQMRDPVYNTDNDPRFRPR